jgi:hypothetical protein
MAWVFFANHSGLSGKHKRTGMDLLAKDETLAGLNQSLSNWPSTSFFSMAFTTPISLSEVTMKALLETTNYSLRVLMFK